MNTLGAVLALLLVMVGPEGVDPANDGTVFSPQRTFRIPLDLTSDERGSLSAIRLYVSEDAGHTWVRHSDGDPRMDVITFRAKQDGEYWFTIALVDKDGRQIPDDVRTVEPGLKVTVDTQKPEMTLRAIRNKAGRRGIAWTLEDAHVVDSSLRLAVWNDAAKTWEPFEIRHPEEKRAWFTESENFSKIQGFVTDRAGNERVIQVEVFGEQFTKQDIDVFALSENKPADVKVASATEPTSPTDSAIQTTSHKVPESELPSDVTVCSSHQIVVNYMVDQPAAGATQRGELWASQDQGETWNLVAVDQDGKSPVEAKLEADGRWGLRILVRDGDKATAGPPKGAKPEMFIEIDTTAPDLKLPTPRVVDGQLVVTWQAADKNFDAQPIDLLYSPSPKGPWHPVANGLRNTGEYVWNVASAEVPAKFYLRIEARDRGRNVGFAQTAEPIDMHGTPLPTR